MLSAGDSFIAIEYGVMGFLLFFGMLIYAIYESGFYAARDDRRDREVSFLAPAGIAIASFIVIKAVFNQRDNHPLIYMILGMICALVWRLKRSATAEADATAVQPADSQVGGPRRPARPASHPARPYRS